VRKVGALRTCRGSLLRPGRLRSLAATATAQQILRLSRGRLKCAPNIRCNFRRGTIGPMRKLILNIFQSMPKICLPVAVPAVVHNGPFRQTGTTALHSSLPDPPLEGYGFLKFQPKAVPRFGSSLAQGPVSHCL
jgi:hypothetical protein